ISNPYEFQEKISPRLRSVDVVVDKVDLSVLKCVMAVGFFIPTISYVAESKYEPGERISFKCVGGDLKDFRGEWRVRPLDAGKKCELTYQMYVDPGIPVPQWIVRTGVRIDLPNMLVAVRNRVCDLSSGKGQPELRSILAVGMHS